MPWHSPHERRVRRIRGLWICLALCIVLLALTFLDRRLYLSLRREDWDGWKGRDWVQLLRVLGYLPTWILIGVCVFLAAPRSLTPPAGCIGGRRLAVLLPLAAALGGASCELLKVVLLRHRPSDVNGGAYMFDWIEGALPGRGLGLASSHAGVAFGAAFLLWRYSRPAGLFAIILASGCMLTRLLAGAHFATDGYVAAILGWCAAWLVWRIAGTKDGASA